jgi:hypothetical protein
MRCGERIYYTIGYIGFLALYVAPILWAEYRGRPYYGFRGMGR